MPEARIAILYPTDPAASVPSGIDSFIRGILKYAPADLRYTLFGASSDLAERPLGTRVMVRLGERAVDYLPIVSVDPTGARSRIPLTVRYLRALRQAIRRQALEPFEILDFHRIEPVYWFRNDPRPKNLVLHQDMSILRDKNSDIMWSRAPWAYEAIERRLFEHLDNIFTVRRSAVERYARLYPHLARNIRFIPTWVDTSIFKPCESAQQRARLREALARSVGAPSDASLVTFVGRLDKQKDPLLLLAAFHAALQSHPKLHLVLLGDGSMRAEVESQIRGLALNGKVSLLGILPPERICEVLRASDIFALSSAYEGMPIAVLEALATGLPVASTDVGEIGAVVTGGINGFICKERSANALADALCRALDRSEALRGAPCTSAVAPYHPASVLGRLYELHRGQAAQQQRGL